MRASQLGEGPEDKETTPVGKRFLISLKQRGKQNRTEVEGIPSSSKGKGGCRKAARVDRSYSCGGG